MNEILLCPWEASHYLFFSSNVPALVHYSHLIAALAALVIGAYVFLSDSRSPVNRLFLFLVSTFGAWIFLDLILWATNRPDIVMFAWSLQILLEPLTYGIAFYLFYLYVYREWPSFRTNALVAALFLPIIVLLPSELNLTELNLADCEAIEGPLAKYYTHFVHAILTASIAFLGIRGAPRLATRQEIQVAFLFGFGLLSFLLAFSSGTIIGSFTDDWVPSQYGLFGMPFFAACIAYGIIRFNAFNAKVLTAEMLVVALGIGTVSLVALRDISSSARIVASATFILVCVVGFILVRNVRKEVAQRLLIEKQEKDLEAINQQQETLLHFISHEVKGFLTEGQNAFAGIVEGDFGAPPEKIRGMSQIALGKMRNGVSTVMDILDASNLKKGTMQYRHAPLDFKHAVISVVDDLTIAANAKGITIDIKLEEGDYQTDGDEEKLKRHVIRNLIDNAIKYTLEGSILVNLSRAANVIRFTVKDSGVGITLDDMKKLFTEGGHGKDSIKTNVNSTGYGLFVAKSVVEAHHGKIWAESEGQGKGSTFVVELPTT